MRWLLSLLLLSMSLSTIAQGDSNTTQRMDWWRKARLGMFIHWGLYSIPAGKWGDNTNYAEWIRNEAHIPVREYEKFRDQFNPVDFDAEKWVKMAKDAGMKYIVITTKHHDGFCNFDSKYTDWDIMHTPFHRDIMKEMADACHKEGIQICWYHSIMDWHEPDYLPRRDWELKDRPVDGANFVRYVQHLRNQVTELLMNYGQIGVMWFDGQWEQTWNAKYGQPLYDLCRKLQPNVIVNNRVSSGEPEIGDFSTPEQYIPPTGLSGVSWETCMTMNDHWGYNAYDKDWKSPAMLIRNIIDIASKGGNYLLNIGPMSNGEFPPEAVQRLKAIGDYMRVNGDAIYDTSASVFDQLPWGRSTTRRNGATTALYLHVFDWPATGRLVVPSIGNRAEKAELLATGERLEIDRDGSDLVIHVGAAALDPISTTVVLTVEGEPVIYKTPIILAPSPILVSSMSVSLDGGTGQDIRYTTDGADPTSSSSVYSSPISIADTTTVKAAAFRGADRVSAISAATFQKVTPKPASEVHGLKPGMSCNEYHGKWRIMPDFAAMTASRSFVANSLTVPTVGNVPEEFVGRTYSGYIRVPADEVYNYALTSDDGSRLLIDGEVVVDNDGLHSESMKSGSVALAKGPHKIRIEWFNNSGGAALDLKWGKIGEMLHNLAAKDVGH